MSTVVTQTVTFDTEVERVYRTLADSAEPSTFSGDDKRSEIKLTHTGLPEDAAEHIAMGWKNMYWTPLTEYLVKK